jgi:hypothetical protein
MVAIPWEEKSQRIRLVSADSGRSLYASSHIFQSIPCSASRFWLGKRRLGRRRVRPWLRERDRHRSACPHHQLHPAPPEEAPVAAPPPPSQRRPSFLLQRFFPSTDGAHRRRRPAVARCTAAGASCWPETSHRRPAGVSCSVIPAGRSSARVPDRRWGRRRGGGTGLGKMGRRRRGRGWRGEVRRRRRREA